MKSLDGEGQGRCKSGLPDSGNYPASRVRSATARTAVLTEVVCAFISIAACAPSPTFNLVNKDTVPVNGTTLHFEIRGAGPAIVLIHGGQMDRRMWDDQVEALAPEYKVLRYDARGYGESGPVDSPYAAHDDLYALLRFLDIDSVRLVGLSLGGRVALDFTLVHPDMVEALVLAGPGLSGWTWSADNNEFFRPIMAAVQTGDAPRAAQLWLETPYMSPAMEIPGVAERVRRIAEDNAAIWMAPNVETELVPPALDRLAEIRAPTLLIVGSRDVPDIQRIVSTLETGIAGARRITIEGAGHMVNMEQPDAFNRAVLHFLRDVDDVHS